MIKKFLRKIFMDKISIYEAAKSLNITPNEIKNRLQLMEHHGYVIRSDVKKIQCAETCKSCGFGSSCPMAENKGIGDIKGYELTAKGERLIE